MCFCSSAANLRGPRIVVNFRRGRAKLTDPGKSLWSLLVVLLGEVDRVLNQHGVLRNGGDVMLVACSGGLDSVVLARAVVEILGARRVVLAHVDHRVRERSHDDAVFV